MSLIDYWLVINNWWQLKGILDRYKGLKELKWFEAPFSNVVGVINEKKWPDMDLIDYWLVINNWWNTKGVLDKYKGVEELRSDLRPPALMWELWIKKHDPIWIWLIKKIGNQ